MRLITFADQSAHHTGLLLPRNRILDLSLAAARDNNAEPAWGRDMVELIKSAERSVPWLLQLSVDPPADLVIDEHRARVLAPIPRPRKNIFCVGLNYMDHVGEHHKIRSRPGSAPERPIFFTKPPTSVIGPGADIPWHPITGELDYEVELGVIIGRTGKDIPAATAWDYVFGYTIINDVSARDLQSGHGGQWFKGKALDGSCPMGPAIVHTSSVPDPEDLDFTCHVNGELRQQSNTGLMIFNIPTIIESLSAGLTLEPGDIIATGTCAGVGKGFDPPRFLGDGDHVELTIDRIGTLSNRVVSLHRSDT